jgi:hypothetical protein
MPKEQHMHKIGKKLTFSWMCMIDLIFPSRMKNMFSLQEKLAEAPFTFLPM